MYAVKDNRTSLLDRLIDLGSDVAARNSVAIFVQFLRHEAHCCNLIYLQENFNVLHIAAMYSREDVIKILLTKKNVDPFSTGGVSII